MRSRASESVKLGLCRAPSCAGVSLTAAVALLRQSCADDPETVAMALLRQSWADDSETVAAPKLCRRIGTVSRALQCQSSALSCEQAKSPRLRLALS